MKILTTYPIPENTLWQETADLMPRRHTKIQFFKKIGIRDIFLPFRMLMVRHKYDVIFTGAEREDMIFALLQTMLVFNKKPHILADCLWKKERKNMRKIIKKVLIRLVSQSVTKFVVWSKEEVDNYSSEFGISKEKFVFLFHHESIDGYEFKVKNGDYIFAGGNSSRDYRTLIESVGNLNVNVKIALTDYNLIKDVQIPANIEILSPDPKEFRALMAGSRAVIVPLKKGLLQSAGQQTYLNAMIMKKPVIVTDAPGVRDYIKHSETGLVIPPEDTAAMKNMILAVLSDNREIRKMVETAYVKTSMQFTLDMFVKRIILLINESGNYELN